MNEFGEWPERVGGSTLRRDPQGEGQPAAQRRQFCDLHLVVSAVTRRDAAHEGDRFGLRQQVEGDSSSAVAGDEPGHAATAGDHHQA